jgi:hypothetical protein
MMANVFLKIGGKSYEVNTDNVPYLAIRTIIDCTKPKTKKNEIPSVGEMQDETFVGILMMLPEGTFKDIDEIKKIITWKEYQLLDSVISEIVKGDEKKA